MDTDVVVFGGEEALERLSHVSYAHFGKYLAMYSSWLGGIVKDPRAMVVPIDDHMVHRGDGVFEALKSVEGKLYLLDRHLDRLQRSAQAIKLQMPVDRETLTKIIVKTVQASEAKDCVVRIFISRGPGSFSANPTESIGAQLYVVVTTMPQRPPHQYEKGVTVKKSNIPIKPPYFAHVKSCNYLPNVLMSLEAVEQGVDFTVSVDEEGYLGEGPTENIAIVTNAYEFLVPRFGKTLRGTTISRVMELIQDLVTSRVLGRIAEDAIPLEEVYRAHEVMMFGTTFDVLPVVSVDEKKIGSGKPGPFFKKILKLLRQDMRENSAVTTPVFS